MDSKLDLCVKGMNENKLGLGFSEAIRVLAMNVFHLNYWCQVVKIQFLIGFSISAFLTVCQAMAQPMKCVVDGKTLYTDDQGQCAKGAIKPINGSVLISSSPKATPGTNNNAKPALELPSGLNGILHHFGITEKEMEDGWQTVMEAHKRGSWKAPEMPEDDK